VLNAERIDELVAKLPQEYQESLRIWDYNSRVTRSRQQRSKYWKGMKLPPPGVAMLALKDLFVEELGHVLEAAQGPEGPTDPKTPGSDQI
jgi:hypothetical protein